MISLLACSYTHINIRVWQINFNLLMFSNRTLKVFDKEIFNFTSSEIVLKVNEKLDNRKNKMLEGWSKRVGQKHQQIKLVRSLQSPFVQQNCERTQSCNLATWHGMAWQYRREYRLHMMCTYTNFIITVIREAQVTLQVPETKQTPHLTIYQQSLYYS